MPPYDTVAVKVPDSYIEEAMEISLRHLTPHDRELLKRCAGSDGESEEKPVRAAAHDKGFIVFTYADDVDIQKYAFEAIGFSQNFWLLYQHAIVDRNVKIIDFTEYGPQHRLMETYK